MRYTLLRLGVLAVVGALLWAVGLRGALWAVVSLLVAAAASYVLLSSARTAVLEQLEARRAAAGAGSARAGRRPGRARPVSDEEAEDAAGPDDTAGRG